MPPMLAFPRPEIFVLQMTLPVSMQCVASLFAMHRWQPIVVSVLNLKRHTGVKVDFVALSTLVALHNNYEYNT